MVAKVVKEAIEQLRWLYLGVKDTPKQLNAGKKQILYAYRFYQEESATGSKTPLFGTH